jgi:hypothetical protein
MASLATRQTNATAADPGGSRKLTGPERAAILMLALGEQ